MLTEQEIQQICRRYVPCPVCGQDNSYYRLKRDMARGTEIEGDGHPLKYRWGKPGFDTVDPKRFFLESCSNCGFTGELDDADFRQSGKDPDKFKSAFNDEQLQGLVNRSATGKGIAQVLKKRVEEGEPLTQMLAQFHLGVYIQCLRSKILPGNIARYYLRIAWLFREQERYYGDANVEEEKERLERIKERWEKDLPDHKDYPELPQPACNEAAALFLSRAYFERNYETLREAKQEDELRLQLLLAEIGFRLYELTDGAEDYKKAASYFSGTMQRCLSIINDKTIVGGAVNRAKELLESSGDRGRELRALRKSRGGGKGSKSKGEKSKGEKSKNGKKAKSVGENGTGSDVVPEEDKPAIPTSQVQDPAASAAATAAAPAVAAAPEAVAAAAPTEEPSENSDQATRRVSLLQEEVENLREQLKSFEEDNKKWRQLAGRDSLTGLNNKVMLFRLVLPKEIKRLEKGLAYSCIAIGLDLLQEVNKRHGWTMGDRMLREAVKGLRSFVEEGDELYRLDGANFVLFGPMTNNVARMRAADMHRRLGKASVQIDKVQLPLVASMGVVTVERSGKSSPMEAAEAMYQVLLSMLYKAKETNAVETHSATHF